MNVAEYTLPTEEAIAHNILNGLVSRSLFMLDMKTESDTNTNYKPLYYGLFNCVTTILRNATTYEQTVAALKLLQCEAEDAFIEQ